MDSVATEREAVGMDQGPAEMIDRYIVTHYGGIFNRVIVCILSTKHESNFKFRIKIWSPRLKDVAKLAQ